MTSRQAWISIVPLTAFALALSIGAPEAKAQSLFETLFGGGMKKTRPTNFPPPPPAKRRSEVGQTKAAAAPKITGPGYNTYRADRLVRVDFSPLTRAAVPIAYQPGAQTISFDDAVGGLDNFELFAEKDIGAALTGYYARNRNFIWVDQAAPNARAAEAIRVLGEAGRYGLDPRDYLVAVPPSDSAGLDPQARQRDLIRFEMALSARLLRYVHDATMGRIDPNRISGYYDFPAKPLDLAGVLDTLSHTSEIRTYLETRHPQNPEYQALRVELESLEASGAGDEIRVDPKLVLKPGQSSPELPKLISLVSRDLDDELGGEYGETLWRMGQSEIYSDDLVPVFKAVQERAGLKSDGVVGPRTVNAVAGTSNADKIEKVRIALEQMRWLPSDLGSPRIFVNQPAFTASFIEGDTEKLNMRVVIGAPSTQTSFFYDEIEQVDYNPYWGVPQSIIVNEMLPRLRRDPGYLDRAGYEVTDAKGRRIPSSEVDWGRYGAKVPYSVRQTPSEANALGELKILFPNEHAIYMHDTPVKNLFQRDMRAFSHGCIRLQDPRGMAAAVLGTTVDHIAEKLTHGHSTEKVPAKIPVYIAYFTAWPTVGGKVEYFGDVYDRDAKLKLALAATEAARAPGS
ncbi:L,D-transpeptidase family protein [Mesorhizobium yinganensis]|uniref:L,D-transpeptidase family protein n=1 Tax=Mesorhizobium yinganensis TaxID=3157707 RepID=UPI0032B85DF4